MGTMRDDRFQLLGKTLKDEFRVDRFVAEGGFGVVFKATQLTVGREVAIKVLKTPDDLDPEARAGYLQRFAEEARTLGRLAHPAIVQVLDFGIAPLSDEGDTAWMALEWIPGETLEDELMARRHRGGRTPAEAMALLRDVLRAMAHAHDLGFAHRDLKPANVMIVRGKRDTTVRLLDFGIAKVMDPDEQAGSGVTRTKSARSVCSPRYAAPEQLSGARSGPWSDVHALGLLLTEVLTDRAVYPGKTLNAILVDALSRTRPTPAKLGVDVGAWEPVLARALALRPDDRFPDAGALLEALEAALPGATHASLAPVPGMSAPGAPLATAPGPSLAYGGTDADALPMAAHSGDAVGPRAHSGVTGLPTDAPRGVGGYGAALPGMSSRMASSPAVPSSPSPRRRSLLLVLSIAVAAALTMVGGAVVLRRARTMPAQVEPRPGSPRLARPAAPLPSRPAAALQPAPAPVVAVTAAEPAALSAPQAEPEAARPRAERRASRPRRARRGYDIE